MDKIHVHCISNMQWWIFTKQILSNYTHYITIHKLVAYSDQPDKQICTQKSQTEITLNLESDSCENLFFFLFTCEGDCSGEQCDPSLRISKLLAWEARYSSATTISPISGRKFGCSWRHIAVMAIAWCKQRKGKRPSRSGSTNCTNFLRSFKNWRDWKQKK